MHHATPILDPPTRSLEQRREALDKANAIRVRRAQLKRDIKARLERVPVLLLDPPEWLETMKIFDLMLAIPKVGRVKVNQILVRHRISASKTIGGLSQRQRTELVVVLAPYDVRLAPPAEARHAV